MAQLTIRHTAQADIDRVMEILDIARRFMWPVGNTSQWPEGYPTRATIERDVKQGHSYVCCNGEGIPVAVFCFASGPDATCAKIEDGKWLNDRPYHVIHRIADGTPRIAYQSAGKM